MSHDLINRQELMKLLGIRSSATVYRLIHNQGLPAPRKLTPSKRGKAFWRKDKVQDWLDSRPTADQGAES